MLLTLEFWCDKGLPSFVDLNNDSMDLNKYVKQEIIEE